VHWARLEASALGSLIAACPAWKKEERRRAETDKRKLKRTTSGNNLYTTSSHRGTSRRRIRGRSDASGKDRSQIPQRLRCQTKRRQDFWNIQESAGKLHYIGNTPIDIRDDNLIVGDQEYEGTPGHWELIISKQPDANVYSHDDFENYAKIMVDTSALKQNNNPAEAVPKCGVTIGNGKTC